jgi:hypothetical protein
MAARLKAYDFAMAIRAFPKKLARSLPKSESAKTLVESAANKRYLCTVDNCNSVASSSAPAGGLGSGNSVGVH